ncbi:MAG: hypothetical protein IJ339_03040, partial [Oscillospiraceae bacterium]|nr:hypothetical protein [Oscillospiraceae bacterium]
SILYKCIAMLLKKHRYIVPLCFVISAVFKLWFEDPVYIFSLNQGLKYLIYLALGGALYPHIKQISDKNWQKLSAKQRAVAIFAFIMIMYYIYLLYKRGYVFWPQAIWALSLVYFVNVVVIIAFVIVISLILEKFSPFVWVGQNTLGFCCLENINRALLNTAMAVVGFGFVPDNEIKALVHVMASMCVGSVIILIISKTCPQLLGKKKSK